MTYTLYLDYAITLDEIELRAALALIFAQLKSKVNDTKNKFLEQSLYLNRCVKEYRLLKLNEDFSKSPWKEALFDFELIPPFSRQDESLDSYPGFRLQQLLTLNDPSEK